MSQALKVSERESPPCPMAPPHGLCSSEVAAQSGPNQRVSTNRHLGNPLEEPSIGASPLTLRTQGQLSDRANATKCKPSHPTWQLQCSPPLPRALRLIMKWMKEQHWKRICWYCSPKSHHNSCLTYFKFFFQGGTKFHNFGLDPVKELLVIMVQIP